jgi:predicted translin family RNA/ssDNA-binding protein
MYKVSKLENYLDSAVRVMKQLDDLNKENINEYKNLVNLQNKRDELNNFLDQTNNTVFLKAS